MLLAVGEQAYVEFFVDDAVNYNFLLGLTHYGEYAERILRLVQRPMLTSVTGCTGVKPMSLEGVQPPRD